jgi:hypothetical protein
MQVNDKNSWVNKLNKWMDIETEIQSLSHRSNQSAEYILL